VRGVLLPSLDRIRKRLGRRFPQHEESSLLALTRTQQLPASLPRCRKIEARSPLPPRACSGTLRDGRRARIPLGALLRLKLLQ